MRTTNLTLPYFGANTITIWRPSSRGELLDLGLRVHHFLDAVEHPGAEFLVHHLAATEAQGELDLVALFQESASRSAS
jgi:hypothetical protein